MGFQSNVFIVKDTSPLYVLPIKDLILFASLSKLPIKFIHFIGNSYFKIVLREELQGLWTGVFGFLFLVTILYPQPGMIDGFLKKDVPGYRLQM